jgi:hypothetical protein
VEHVCHASVGSDCEIGAAWPRSSTHIDRVAIGIGTSTGVCDGQTHCIAARILATVYRVL